MTACTHTHTHPRTHKHSWAHNTVLESAIIHAAARQPSQWHTMLFFPSFFFINVWECTGCLNMIADVPAGVLPFSIASARRDHFTPPARKVYFYSPGQPLRSIAAEELSCTRSSRHLHVNRAPPAVTSRVTMATLTPPRSGAELTCLTASHLTTKLFPPSGALGYSSRCTQGLHG